MVLTHLKLDYPIIKLLATEFIISHTFLCERYFSFACVLENVKKFHKGEFAGHWSI